LFFEFYYQNYIAVKKFKSSLFFFDYLNDRGPADEAFMVRLLGHENTVLLPIKKRKTNYRINLRIRCQMNFRKRDIFWVEKVRTTKIRTSKVENENIESQKIINLRKVFSTKIKLLKIEDEVNSSIEKIWIRLLTVIPK
jgi:hypothetical protein